MATKIYIHGRVAWMATNGKVKYMLIDPNKTPKEEIWRFCRACSNVWLNKSRIYSYDQQAIEDLETDSMIRTYHVLLRRVREGRYRRDLSFYLNVRSCAWEAVSHCISAFQTQARHSKITESLESEAVDGIPYSNIISYSNTFLTDSDDYRNRRAIDPWLLKHPKRRARAMEEYMVSEYFRYVEECLEYGIEDVLAMDKWIELNKNQLDPQCQAAPQ